MSQLPTYRMKNYPSSIVAAGYKTVENRCTPHWHDCCEVELVLSGSGVHYINGTSRPLKAGDIYMLTTFDHHEIVADERIGVLGIMFDDALISDELFGQLMSLESVGVALSASLPEPIFTRVKGYFEAVIAEEDRLGSHGSSDIEQKLPQKSPPETELSRLYIGKLLDCILVETVRTLNADLKLPDNRLIRDAVLYIFRHFREPITLSELAGSLYLSESYLSRLFGSVTGQSFKRLLIDLRLRCACRMLTTTGLSATEICYDCGFGSYSHFMRSFREHYGMSPMTFRELHSKK